MHKNRELLGNDAVAIQADVTHRDSIVAAARSVQADLGARR
jgi:hypothetical protein